MRLAVLALVSVLVACSGSLRNTPETRYQNMLLDARNLGAQVVERAAAAHPEIRTAIQQNGQPDFVYQPGPDSLELIWYQASRLLHFDWSGPTTEVSELTPLPQPLLALLPGDIRAGTPGRDPGEFPGVACWTVAGTTQDCRTCCTSTIACTTSCRARS